MIKIRTFRFKTNNINDLDISSETIQNKKKFAEYSEGLNYNYWGLDKNATLREVIEVIRDDEAGHRDRNHAIADSI